MVKLGNRQFLAMGLVMLLISACSESGLQMLPNDDSGEPSGSLTLTAPKQILSARAVNLDALVAEITTNGNTERFQRGATFTTTVSVAPGETLNLQILWYLEEPNTTPLLLSSYSTSQVITENTSISIASSQYNSEGDGFDADGDNYYNLNELQNDSDPNNSNVTPLNRPDVVIGWVNPTEVPVIDGLYDDIWNRRAVFNDVRGERLSIDNLMINQGAIRPNGNTEFQWAAMHDDTYLYLFVLSENVDQSTPYRDSSSPWNDDNINLFFDGNNSGKANGINNDSTVYDNFDDRHVFVPFLTNPDNQTPNSSFFQRGENSVAIDNIEFATCLCTSGRHTWEFKLPLAQFNITKNVPFGFDIQLDIDHDGGARDARWGWFHPARTTEDVDNTWRNPSYMGTAIIQ